MVATAQPVVALSKGVVDVGVVLFLKPILKGLSTIAGLDWTGLDWTPVEWTGKDRQQHRHRIA